MAEQELAILGGSKAITVSSHEGWKPRLEEEKKLVCELIERRELSGSGHGFPKQVEDQFRAMVGCKYVLSVNHGSTAIQSALYAVGVGPGDEVITPTIGYIGSYGGALHLGARVVFCECDPKTLLIDPEDVEKRITPRTRAILPIHMRGEVCDMDALLAIGRKYGVAIVEDAAHAHGAAWDGIKIGNVGDIAAFSFQGGTPGGKPICGGEGGIVATNNREFYERQLIYCHLHRSGIADELTNPEYRALGNQGLGTKWRAHPLALALAKVSMDTLEERLEKSRTNRKKLFEGLKEIPGVDPVCAFPKATPAPLYGGHQLIYHSEELGGLPILKFNQALEAEGAPIGGLRDRVEHLRHLFAQGFDFYGHGRGQFGEGFVPYKPGDLPVSEDVAKRAITIPSYMEPADGFLDQFLEAFRKVTENYEELL